VDAAASGAQRHGRAGWRKACEPSTARRRTKLTRTAKPCGPGARCWCQVGGGVASPTGSCNTVNSPTTVTRTNSSPGRARHKPLKPLRAGMPGDSGATVVTTVCYLPMHTGCGCIGHPAFPTPSLFWAEIFAQLGRIAPRDRATISKISASPYRGYRSQSWSRPETYGLTEANYKLDRLSDSIFAAALERVSLRI
jgi:hypothetical protein